MIIFTDRYYYWAFFLADIIMAVLIWACFSFAPPNGEVRWVICKQLVILFCDSSCRKLLAASVWHNLEGELQYRQQLGEHLAGYRQQYVPHQVDMFIFHLILSQLWVSTQHVGYMFVRFNRVVPSCISHLRRFLSQFFAVMNSCAPIDSS